jgi:hypothetical protein
MLSSISVSTLIPIALAILTIRFLISTIRFPARLSLPGPALSRFTNLWYLWQMKRGDFHKTNIELHQQHGKYHFCEPRSDVLMPFLQALLSV